MLFYYSHRIGLISVVLAVKLSLAVMAIVIEVIHDSSPLHSICSNPTEIAMCAHNNIILINKLRPQTPPSSSLISADKA